MTQHVRVRRHDRSHPRERAVTPVTTSTPILVVDDFSTMVRILRKLLHQIELHDVDDAADAWFALKLMRKKRYGLVISDCNMRGMNGYELLREVRKNPALEMTPVLLITADPSVARFVQETDLTQYLIKPFSAEMLKAKVQTLTSGYIASSRATM